MVPKNCKESGFSLIEVAIALIVISLLMTPLIYAYNIHMETKRSTITTGRVDGISSALLKFYERNGFYPTPAQPNVAQGTAGFGVPAGGVWPVCAATSTTVCRTPNTGFGPAPAATNGILIGSVPIAALGLPFKLMLDGYGNRLTYAVSENLTTMANFRDDRGAVTVRNNAGTDAQAHFAIVSHGKTRMGSFTLAGIKAIACNTATVPVPADSQNCNNDALFLSNFDGGSKTLVSEGNNTAFFDDKLAFTNTTAYGIWSYIPNSGLDMQSRSIGNIKIGCPAVGACEPVAKLDVEGNVLANEVQTSRICDSDAAGCVSTWSGIPAVHPRNGAYGLGWFSPDMLTGAPSTAPSALQAAGTDGNRQGIIGQGIACYSDYALRGINGYDEYCAGPGTTSAPTAPHLTATTVNNCPSGQLAKAIIIRGANSFDFDCVVSW